MPTYHSAPAGYHGCLALTFTGERKVHHVHPSDRTATECGLTIAWNVPGVVKKVFRRYDYWSQYHNCRDCVHAYNVRTERKRRSSRRGREFTEMIRKDPDLLPRPEVQAALRSREIQDVCRALRSVGAPLSLAETVEAVFGAAETS